MADQQHYGIFLTEGDFGDSVYAYSFTQEELADWIEASVDFGETGTSAQVAVPGYEDRTIGVTVGSTANDKLLGLMGVGDDYAPHHWLKPTTSEDEDEAYEELVELCGEEYIYEGLVY